MQELTKAEETIMYCIWKKADDCTTGDIMEMMEVDYGKKYVASTLCVFMASLRKKNYVSYHKKGTTYIYRPLVEKQVYQIEQLRKLVDECFEGSVVSLLETIIRGAGNEDVSMKDILRYAEEMGLR